MPPRIRRYIFRRPSYLLNSFHMLFAALLERPSAQRGCAAAARGSARGTPRRARRSHTGRELVTEGGGERHEVGGALSQLLGELRRSSRRRPRSVVGGRHCELVALVVAADSRAWCAARSLRLALKRISNVCASTMKYSVLARAGGAGVGKAAAVMSYLNRGFHTSSCSRWADGEELSSEELQAAACRLCHDLHPLRLHGGRPGQGVAGIKARGWWRRRRCT